MLLQALYEVDRVRLAMQPQRRGDRVVHLDDSLQSLSEFIIELLDKNPTTRAQLAEVRAQYHLLDVLTPSFIQGER